PVTRTRCALYPYTTLFRSPAQPAADPLSPPGVLGTPVVGVERPRPDQTRSLGDVKRRLAGKDDADTLVLGDGKQVLESGALLQVDRKSTRLNSSHVKISYA